jgi:transcriptional regulator with XRE-family HTH domain
VQTAEYDALLAFLRQTREATGISQRELSQKLGETKTYISDIERGKRRLDMIEFYRIARALGHDPAVLGKELFEAVARQAHGSRS